MKNNKSKTTSFLIVGFFLIFMSFVIISCSKGEYEIKPETAYCGEGCLPFNHNGTERTYYLNAPTTTDENTLLIFSLHGYHGDATDAAWSMIEYSLWQDNIVLVNPQGLADLGGILHWNAGYDFSISNTDDVGFLSALAQELQTQYNINPAKTFVLGISNGGNMSYQLVYKRPDIFKAAASVIGRMGNDIWENKADLVPVSILQISGALDPAQNDYTDEVLGGWGGTPDMETQIDFWANLNATTTLETTQVTPNTTATKHTNGVNGNQVWYYVVDDMGHEVPFGENDRIHAYQVILEFFRQIDVPLSN